MPTQSTFIYLAQPFIGSIKPSTTILFFLEILVIYFNIKTITKEYQIVVIKMNNIIYKKGLK